LRCPGKLTDLVGSDLGGCFVAVPLDDPALVVGLPERLERQAQLLDRVEAANPQEVFFQHPDEALGAAIAFGLAHEGWRALQAEEADLALEMVADILRPMIVTEREARGDVLGERAEARTHRLPDRLHRLSADGGDAGGAAPGPGAASM